MRRFHIPAVIGSPLLACATVALVLGIAASRAAAQCPPSFLSTPGTTSTSTTATQFGVNGPDGSWIQGNHATAEYSLHHSGSLTPTTVTAQDRYDVVGVPPGTRVPVLLVLRIQGWTYTTGCGGSGCCGSLVATIRAGSDTTQVTLVGNSFGGRADFSGGAALPVVLTAGGWATIQVELRARRCPGGSHTVDATAQLAFQGTDPAASVTSCKGLGPVPVPVRRTSWGETKVRYR